MWGRSQVVGMYLARRQEQLRIETARRISELNSEIQTQQQYLYDWLNDPNNRRFAYFDEVRSAHLMLVAPFVTKPVLADVQNKLDDLKALNKAIVTQDVADLIQRAKNYMDYDSPLAMALGTSFAVIGLGIIVASFVFLACPALAIVGALAVIAGCVAALMGAKKTPTDRTHTLFSVAQAIDRNVDVDRDLFEKDAAIAVERKFNMLNRFSSH